MDTAVAAETPRTPESATEPIRTVPARAPASIRLLAILAVIAALWWGQRFAIPVTVGLMVALLVMPLAQALENLLHSAAAAAVISLLVVLGALVGGGALFGAQLVRVAERTPQMISMAAFQLAQREAGNDSLLRRAREALRQFDRVADRVIAGHAITPDTRPLTRRRGPSATLPAAPASSATGGDAAQEGATAAGASTSITATATEALRDTAVSGSSLLAGFAGTLTVVFFISFFVLTGGRPLMVRFLGLWGYDIDVHHRASRALLECGRQIRLYAGILLLTNTIIGVVVWLSFLWAGLPDAGGWGVAAAVLHAMPYAGMAVLTALGAAETYLAHASVGAALGMAGFLVVMSTLIGTLVTAWLQGRAARMNPASVFIGLVFWGSLWGLWGLFLGPALVVMLKVVAEHTPSGQRLARVMQG